VRGDPGERAAHLLGRLAAQDLLERRVLVDLAGVGRGVVASTAGSVASSRPANCLRARLRATPQSHEPIVPRVGSKWLGLDMKNMKVSWVTSAALAVEPQ
jgi:hypothetical protein